MEVTNKKSSGTNSASDVQTEGMYSVFAGASFFKIFILYYVKSGTEFIRKYQTLTSTSFLSPLVYVRDS
jgi:hypothetical protein